MVANLKGTRAPTTLTKVKLDGDRLLSKGHGASMTESLGSGNADDRYFYGWDVVLGLDG